jgi:DNA polymerase-3 subunit beta
MKFSAPLSEFHKTLQKTLPAIPPKSTIQVLEHLSMRLEGSKLNIIGTDQDITIMSTLEVTGETDGSILVPAKKLNEIVKALGTKGTFEFTASDDSFDITIVTSKGKYGMKGLNPDDYLDLPELFDSEKPEINNEMDSGTIEVGTPSAQFLKDDIVRLADKTVMAVSTDEFRPAMTGVLFQFRENYVNAVSTDSFRLVKAVVRSEKADFPQEFDVIIPAKSVELLRKSDKDVEMSVIESNGKVSHLRFDYGNTIFITRVINEKFSPYESVIPTDNPFYAIVDKGEIEEAIKRVSIFTSTFSKQVKFKFDRNVLTISGEEEETGNQAVEQINCDYIGDPLNIGFNYKYFEEALNNIHDEETEDNLVKLSFSEPSKPALLSSTKEDDDLLMLIMPVRIND